MIDLMNDGESLNGKNKPDNIPCPACSELKAIHGLLKEFAIYDGEPPLLTLSMLFSEVKMWRAREDYEKNLKLVAKSAIIKKLEDDGYEVES